MVRTQVYLTEKERTALRRLADERGTSQSALIRTAIDQMIAQEQEENWQSALENIKGIWADRDDLPDFEALRREADC